MYEGFQNFVKTIGGVIKNPDILMYIAIGLLGALLVYEIIMTIVLFIKRRHKNCICNYVQLNSIRRWIAIFVAWVFFIFAILQTIPLENFLGSVRLVDVMLPVAFLVIFYLIEIIFMAINRIKCKCTCCDDEKKNNEPIIVTEEPAQMITPAPIISEPTIVPIIDEPKPAPAPRPKPAPKPAPAVVAPAPQPETLSAKIEHQQQVVSQQKVGFSTPTPTSPVEKTATGMDELQRRMAALRQSAAPAKPANPDTAKVGYYSASNSFERTGSTEHLSKLPQNNKFDEGEVKSALDGLKSAMVDLQRKTDTPPTNF